MQIVRDLKLEILYPFTFEGVCERLQNIVQSPVPEGARKTFDAIRKHRNKMVHFFHEADSTSGPKIEAIAREQLRAWYNLHKLLTGHWAPIFNDYGDHFALIEKKLNGHREFLRAKYDDLVPSINIEKSKRIQFRICGSCSFEAARVSIVLGTPS